MCFPAPPTPYTWASGVSSSSPGLRDNLLSGQVHACNFPLTRYASLTSGWAALPLRAPGPGRRGTSVSSSVAILAAGQGIGGSDVLSRAEEAGHVADYKGGSDIKRGGGGGRAVLELMPSMMGGGAGNRGEITSGALQKNCKGSEVGRVLVIGWSSSSSRSNSS